MSECLPDLPRYVRQRDNEWHGADHPDGPWRLIPAPQSGLPWPVPPTDQPTPLSPAAQAVWDAWSDAYEEQGPLEDMGQPLGAALRAAADRAEDLICDTPHPMFVEGVLAAAHLLALIAAELEKP